MKIKHLIVAIIALTSCHSAKQNIITTGISSSQSTPKNEWDIKKSIENGDLLFNIHLNGTEFGDAIVQATKGDAENTNISHVAIVIKDSASTSVIEATGKYGVRICPIDTFLNNSDHSNTGQPLVLVGRLKDRSTITQSISRAKSYLGRPYDWLFSDTEDAIYCSELVHLSYLDSLGNHIFPQQPMSFHDNTGAILPYWIEYYKQKGLEVPEGAPGTNPSAISKSDKIVIIKSNDSQH